MNEKEFENIIRKSLNVSEAPSRGSLTNVLSSISNEENVTKESLVRYNKQTATSNIINNKLIGIIAIWKSKRLVLIPSLVLVIIVSTFSLSPRYMLSRESVAYITAQDESIEMLGNDTGEDMVLADFEIPDMLDLDTLTNEI